MHIIVVGGGILGASTAYHLAGSGARVTLIDEAHAGQATAAGAGIVCPWTTNIQDPDFYRFNTEAGAYYTPLLAALAEAGESEVGYRKVGALSVSDEPGGLDAFEARVRARTADVPEAGTITRLSPAEVAALCPPLRPGFEGLLIPGGARVEAQGIADALRRAAMRKGATVRHGHAVLSHAGRKVAVAVDGTPIDGDAVVATTGAWAAGVLQPLGIMADVAPQKGQIVHLQLPGTDTGDWPVILQRGAKYYLLGSGDGRIVIGASREYAAGFDARVTAAGQAEVLRAALTLAPGLAHATLVATKVGFRPYTTRVTPFLERPAAYDNLVAGGLGANGITLGPYAGKLLAQLALGQTPALDLHPYPVVLPSRPAAHT